MKNFELFSKKSLLFAPMEGVTDEAYRIAMMKTFPEWDRFYTDFYRVPSTGKVTEKMIIEHFGKRIYQDEKLKNKNSFQILASARSQTKECIEIIDSLNFSHLDLNLGCPSKKVNSNLGGAYLLSDHASLKNILSAIRNNFKGTFTVKMRIGYRDDSNFTETLKLIEDHGVEAITLHARTRDQLYKGTANWDYIKKAVETIKIPIIGNGDIWKIEDVDDIFSKTNCHSVMFGRSALKTPWLAKIYYDYKNDGANSDETFLLFQRKNYLDEYFYSLIKEFREIGLNDQIILKRFKSLSLNLFDDYDNGQAVRANFLRAINLSEFLLHLENLK